MKKLLFLFASLFITVVVVNAQDTLRQQNQTKTQQQKRDRIHQEEHLMFMDGKLYQFQNGVRSQVQSQMKLRNGGTVNPDGSYQLKNQERMQLHSGECLDLDGNRYQNQNMFNQRQMMTQQQMHQQMQQHKNMNQQKNQAQNKQGGGKN